MERLFFESFEHEDKVINFEWLQTGFKEFEQIDLQVIVDYVQSLKLENETFLYFYTEIINDDAIGDCVRTMITVRYSKLTGFSLNINISDSLQAMHMDQINNLKTDLLQMLNMLLMSE
ncbi:MAG: hypothetical protein ACRCUP_02355 [Mycoplasmatales bacterium]